MVNMLLRRKKGFTLVEIMIVVIIIGILIAIAIPKYVDLRDTAEQSVWKYNSSYVVKVIALNISKFNEADRYAAPNAGDFNYSDEGLNNLLEKELEYYQANSNKDSIKNPRSGSKKILHGDNPSGGSIADGRNAAVFITGNSAYSHEGGGSTDNLIGSIVTYINQAEPYNVQVYYIDADGNKSNTVLDMD